MLRRTFSTRRTKAFCRLLLLGMLLASAPGCAWIEKLKGPGFAGWDENGSSMRGKNADTKPSGFFTDRRSEQIERNLGGNF